MADACTLERTTQDGKELLVLRHADGGFRLFEQQSDGSVIAADGADAAQAVRSGDVIEISVGVDHYRVPVADDAAD